VLTGCGKTASSDTAAASDTAGGTQTAAQAKDYTPGTRTDTDYTSEWLGLQYKLSDNMVMASDDEINSMMQAGVDTLYKDSSDGQKILDYANISTVYEMMAVNVTNSSSVIVIAEKLALSGTTEEQYIAAMKQQFGSMDNVTVTVSDPTARDLCGISFKEVSYTLAVNGASTNQTALIKKIGDRMSCIMLTYSDTAALNTLLAGFSAV